MIKKVSPPLRDARRESAIQKEILSFLSLCGFFVFRVNTTGVYDPVRKVFRRLGGFNMKGVADIIGVLPNGQFLAVEVKTATGRQSLEQKIFEKNVKANNGIYILARSIDDVRWIANEFNKAA